MSKNRSILLKRLLSIIWLLLLSFHAHADEPLPEPTLKTLWSRDNNFCAVMDPDKRITTVYHVNKNGKKIELWSMFGWFRVADLSTDGKHLVTGYDGIN